MTHRSSPIEKARRLDGPDKIESLKRMRQRYLNSLPRDTRKEHLPVHFQDTESSLEKQSLFWITVGIVMLPASVLIAVATLALWIGLSVVWLLDGDTLAGLFWLLVWGHVRSAIAASIVIGIPFFLLGCLAGMTMRGVAIIFNLQMKALRSFPLKIQRKRREDS